MARNKAQLQLKTCVACGRPLPDAYKSRITCNGACRKRLDRQRKKLRAQSAIVRNALAVLTDFYRREYFRAMVVEAGEEIVRAMNGTQRQMAEIRKSAK